MTFPRKPVEGLACNGCGLCCMIETCELPAILGLDIAEGPSPCPLLEWADGRAWCGLVRSPGKHLKVKPGGAAQVSVILMDMLGNGTCDATGGEGRTAQEAVSRKALGLEW